MYEWKLIYKGPIPGKTLKGKNLGRMYKAGYWELGVHWHANMAAGHFTAEGGKKYGYAKRKGEGAARPQYYKRSYAYRKRRTKGHADPLVWTGKSRSLAKRRHVVATSKGCKTYIHAPALNRRHPKSRVNMRAEMTRVTTGEAHALGKVFTRSADRSLKSFRRKMKIRP